MRLSKNHATIGNKLNEKTRVEREIEVSQSLIAFDTDHIKGYVFGTNKLKEIRGASSLLDKLNRVNTVNIAEKDFKAKCIYANGGAALFLVDSDSRASSQERAEKLGQEVRRLYLGETGGGASITYAIQPIPSNDKPDIMIAKELNKDVTMQDILKLLRFRLRMAKDSLQMDPPSQEKTPLSDAFTRVALPTHALLCTCESCGHVYAQDVHKDEERLCRVCARKQDEDTKIKRMLDAAQEHGTAYEEAIPETRLWGHIIRLLAKSGYKLSDKPDRPDDFNDFRNLGHGKEYLGLIYADANSMGKALEDLETLEAVQTFAKTVDDAVFTAMARAITRYLPVQGKTFPFDILLVGGDDIVMVTPADKAMQVAAMLAEEFSKEAKKYTLSIGVVLAPVTYPFSLQNDLVDETIKAAKKAGATQNAKKVSTTQNTSDAENDEKTEEARINFVVVTGNTSLSYKSQYNEMRRKKTDTSKDEFYATLRPYTLSELKWLLSQLQEGNQKRLGRTKLHQLREAILKRNKTTTIVEALALLRNWHKEERDFMKHIVEEVDKRLTPRQHSMGPLFPWSLDGKESNEQQTVYRTPLLDFIELYDFVSS